MPTDNQRIEFIGVRNNPPCKDCAERHTGCHASCLKYAAYKQALEEEKERYRAFSEPVRIYRSYANDNIDKFKRKEWKK